MTAALLGTVAGLLLVAYLLWEPLTGEPLARYRRPARHSPRELARRWRAEEAAYQAVLDRVWIGAVAEWAARAQYLRDTARC